MDWTAFGLLITGGIFLTAIASLFIVFFSFMAVRTEKRLHKLEAGQADMRIDIAKLMSGQAKLEAKLDKLLERSPA